MSEKVKGCGNVPCSVLSSLIVFTAMFASVSTAFGDIPGGNASLPPSASIISPPAGTAAIRSNSTQMTVTQSTQQMIANWSTFDIASNASVNFSQQSAGGALNRITSEMNTAPAAMNRIVPPLDAGALAATNQKLPDHAVHVGNAGSQHTPRAGVVALISPNIITAGTSNKQVTKLCVDFTGDGLISYVVNQQAVDMLAKNNALIKGDGGLVELTPKAADVLRTSTFTNGGIIEAQTLQNNNGRILLQSGM